MTEVLTLLPPKTTFRGRLHSAFSVASLMYDKRFVAEA
jgi:hypothetical protein